MKNNLSQTMLGREHSGKVEIYTSEESLQNMLLWGTYCLLPGAMRHLSKYGKKELTHNR